MNRINKNVYSKVNKDKAYEVIENKKSSTKKIYPILSDNQKEIAVERESFYERSIEQR